MGGLQGVKGPQGPPACSSAEALFCHPTRDCRTASGDMKVLELVGVDRQPSLHSHVCACAGGQPELRLCSGEGRQGHLARPVAHRGQGIRGAEGGPMLFSAWGGGCRQEQLAASVPGGGLNGRTDLS